MSDLKAFLADVRQRIFEPALPHPNTARQQGLMAAALTLLMFALGLVLYWNRDFWFAAPSEGQIQTEPTQSDLATTSSIASREPAQPQAASPTHKIRYSKQAIEPAADAGPNMTGESSSAEPSPGEPVPGEAGAPITATATRTVLPPLEIEVVAGDVHRSLPAASNSVHVDLQPGASESAAPDSVSQPNSPAPTPSDPQPNPGETAAGTAAQAAERVEISPDTTSVVANSVRPDYPLLARQMKVQGAVALLALISREGQIQNLRVLSGPPILARAAEEAVRQWHFKPHYEGAQAVETQARITVNFTISTN